MNLREDFEEEHPGTPLYSELEHTELHRDYIAWLEALVRNKEQANILLNEVNKILQKKLTALQKTIDEAPSPQAVHSDEPVHKILPILIKDDEGNEFLLENFQQVLDMVLDVNRLVELNADIEKCNYKLTEACCERREELEALKEQIKENKK